MYGKTKESTGMQLIVERYKKIFQIPENTKFYSDKEYLAAEKKFVRYSLLGLIPRTNE